MPSSKRLISARAQPPVERVNWAKYRESARLADGQIARPPDGRLKRTKFLLYGNASFDLGSIEDQTFIRGVQRILRTHESLGIERFGALFEGVVLEIAASARSAGFKVGTTFFEKFVIQQGTEIIRLAVAVEAGIAKLKIRAMGTMH